MKIYNRKNTTHSCATSIPFLKNVNIIPDTMPNCNTIISEQRSSLGRYRTVGVSVIDPKLSYVCNAKNLKICGNININGNVTIGGTTTLDDTIINGDVTINHVTICDLSACNIDISQNLTVGGDFIVEGHTTLEKVTANIVRYQNNSHFFNWGVHIIPVSGEPFRLSLISDIAHGEIISREECEITWGPPTRPGGWIYPGYGGYGGKLRGISWSDRSCYPTDGRKNPETDGPSWAIAIPIPFNGKISSPLDSPPPHARFSWTLGRYGEEVDNFRLDLEIYIINCRHGMPEVIDPAIAYIRIISKCGSCNWGENILGSISWSLLTSSVTIKPSFAIGLYVFRNSPVLFSPATFTLEVQRDI